MLYSSNNGNTRNTVECGNTKKNYFSAGKQRELNNFLNFSLSAFCRKKCNCFFSRSEAALSELIK
jgi:hypothetical protein